MGKFIPNEETWLGFATTLTGTIDAPKVADVDGAVDLTHFLMSLDASSTGNVVPTPALDSLFETSIVGTSSATFTGDFYQDKDTNTAWETLTRGTQGYMILARFGGKPDTADDVCEVWPVRVSSRKASNLQSNTVQTFALTCSVPDEPSEDSTVAA